MRRTALALAVMALAATPALADSLAVHIDQSAGITLPSSARDVMVGNPSIADVTVIDSRHLLVMGRSYGVTNLVVTDARGRTMINKQVVVSAPDDNRITYQRGANLYNYACSPRCERTPLPGEIQEPVYEPFAKPYDSYATRTQGAREDGAENQR